MDRTERPPRLEPHLEASAVLLPSLEDENISRLFFSTDYAFSHYNEQTVSLLFRFMSIRVLYYRV